MQRAIAEMRNVIVRHKKRIIEEDLDKEDHLKAENLNVAIEVQ